MGLQRRLLLRAHRLRLGRLSPARRTGAGLQVARLAGLVTEVGAALSPSASVALTSITALPGATAVSVTRTPAASTVTTSGRRRRHRVGQGVAVGVDERPRHVHVERAVQRQTQIGQGACRGRRAVGAGRAVAKFRHRGSRDLEHGRGVGRAARAQPACAVGNALGVAVPGLARVRETEKARAYDIGVRTLSPLPSSSRIATRPSASVTTPNHSSRGAAVAQFVLSTQFAPFVAR